MFKKSDCLFNYSKVGSYIINSLIHDFISYCDNTITFSNRYIKTNTFKLPVSGNCISRMGINPIRIGKHCIFSLFLSSEKKVLQVTSLSNIQNASYTLPTIQLSFLTNHNISIYPLTLEQMSYCLFNSYCENAFKLTGISIQRHSILA